MQLVNIGFGNLVSVQRLIAIVSPDSAPVKRLVQESRDRGMLIDATYGRKTASVLIMWCSLHSVRNGWRRVSV